MKVLLRAIQAGARSAFGGENSNVPYNDLLAELRELETESPNENG